MAAIDANLGSNSIGSGSSFTLTTTAAAAAGTLIVFQVSYFKGSALTTAVSDSGGSYTLDKRVQNGSDWYEIWSRQATSGLASGSSITMTWGGSSTGAILAGAASFTGIATSAALVTTGSATGSGASWSSGAATNTGQANALYIGGAGSEDATSATSTAVSGTELHDVYNVAGQQGFATGYKIVSTVASDSITGTFSNSGSTKNTGALAIYAAAAGGSTPVSATRALNYDLIAPVSATRALNYSISQSVSATRALSYAILAPVAATRALAYAILMQVAATRGLSYDILSAATHVSATRALKYDLIAPTAATRALTYSIAAQVAATRALKYDIVKSVSATRAINYDLIAPVSTTRRLTYNIGVVTVHGDLMLLWLM